MSSDKNETLRLGIMGVKVTRRKSDPGEIRMTLTQGRLFPKDTVDNTRWRRGKATTRPKDLSERGTPGTNTFGQILSTLSGVARLRLHGSRAILVTIPAQPDSEVYLETIFKLAAALLRRAEKYKASTEHNP